MPTPQRHDRKQRTTVDVRRTRERFLADPTDRGAEPVDVRSEIATSWHRSQRMGVEPDGVEVPYDTEVPTPHRLIDAAVPVVERLVSQLSDTTATVLLANADAHIVRRWASRSFLPTLDRFHVAPGFSFAEHGVGTNGLGCAAEEKRLFVVRGPEHFRECLQSLVCVAAPIVMPTTNTTQGVLNITCTTTEANGFLRPVLERAVADIERQLLEAASVRERAVLDAFLGRVRRTTNPLIAMSDGIAMANPAAERLLSPSDRSLLWWWATEELTSGQPVTRSFELDGSAPFVATAAPIDGAGSAAALIELRPERVSRSRPGGASRHATDAIDRLIVGRSPATVSLRRAVRTAIADRTHVVVVGPRGSGRSFVARVVAGRGDPDAAPAPLPAVSTLGILPAVAEAFDGGAVAFVRGIDRWRPDDARVLLADADAAGVRIVATADEAAVGAEPTRWFAHRVAVPALQERRDDIGALARRILRDLSAGATTIGRDAIGALRLHPWAGNVAELRAVLGVAAAVCGPGEIAPYHLPESIHAAEAGDRWTAIELLERGAILQALSENEGNKVATAAALGLARSTLYRKLRAFEIDVA